MEAMVIMKTFKSFRSISVSFLTISVMLLTLACGDDSDDGESGGTGGSPTATGGSAGGASGTGGSAGGGTTLTGGTGGGGMDAGQPDGATPEPLPQNVAEGGECTMPYEIAGLVAIFTSYGVCQNPSDPCVGGTPDQFDLAPIFPPGSETITSLLPPQQDAAANCASGLVCCIREDQCEAVGEQIANPNSVVAMMMPGVSVSCGAPGSCTTTNEGYSAGELQTGCPTGQTCCVVMPPLSLPEGGTLFPTTDASAPAADASGGQ
jgi:hypothetical protein